MLDGFVPWYRRRRGRCSCGRGCRRRRRREAAETSPPLSSPLQHLHPISLSLSLSPTQTPSSPPPRDRHVQPRTSRGSRPPVPLPPAVAMSRPLPAVSALHGGETTPAPRETPWLWVLVLDLALILRPGSPAAPRGCPLALLEHSNGRRVSAIQPGLPRLSSTAHARTRGHPSCVEPDERLDVVSRSTLPLGLIDICW